MKLFVVFLLLSFSLHSSQKKNTKTIFSRMSLNNNKLTSESGNRARSGSDDSFLLAGTQKHSLNSLFESIKEKEKESPADQLLRPDYDEKSHFFKKLRNDLHIKIDTKFLDLSFEYSLCHFVLGIANNNFTLIKNENSFIINLLNAMENIRISSEFKRSLNDLHELAESKLNPGQSSLGMADDFVANWFFFYLVSPCLCQNPKDVAKYKPLRQQINFVVRALAVESGSDRSGFSTEEIAIRNKATAVLHKLMN